jgi:hypothetical protein
MKLLHNIDKDNDSQPYFLLRLCLVVLSSVFGVIGCSTDLLIKESGTLEHHAIIVDKGGKPYLPIEPSICGPSASCDDLRHWATQEKETYLTDAYDKYLDRLIQSVKTHFGTKKKNLLLFIHGGLNGQENNDRASQLAKQIKSDTHNEYYPIFVNWNSALGSSYGEHLTSVRQGKTDRWAWATSPTYLATDLGRGLIRAPVVWWSLVRNDLTSWPSDKDNWFFNFFDLAKEERNANKIADTLKEEPSNKSFKFWPGDQALSTFWKDRVLGSTTTALTYPIKFLSSPWVDALGKSAWENMLRRTDLLFHTENDFQANPPQSVASGSKNFEASLTTCNPLVPEQQGLVHSQASGALSIFLRKLTKEIHQPSVYGTENDPTKWSITLVGHSMGAIIVNHILRDFGTCLPIDNIVFMAAASTINSYNDSVYPYMIKCQRELKIKRQRVLKEDKKQCELEKDKRKMPGVYHLMLHELAETSERNLWNLPPTGSLLVWIDNFLSTPNTPMDRTSGRFTNLMLSLHTTPEEIRPCISIKRFPGGGSGWGGTQNGIPANHSDFAERFKFWEKACWEVPEGNSDQEKFKNEQRKHCFY